MSISGQTHGHVSLCRVCCIDSLEYAAMLTCPRVPEEAPIAATSSTEVAAAATNTMVPRPTNAALESTDECSKWYTVQQGDYCCIVSMTQNIVLDDFLFLNPGVYDNCTNLLLGSSYCVGAVGDIATYPGYTTTPAPYTLTSMTYTTTSTTPLQAWTRTATAVAALPTAPGTAQGCTLWLDHGFDAGIQDQGVSPVLSGVGSEYNDCAYALFGYNITLQDFLSLNPSVVANGTCTLEQGLRYCVSNATDLSSIDSKLCHPTRYAGQADLFRDISRASRSLVRDCRPAICKHDSSVFMLCCHKRFRKIW